MIRHRRKLIQFHNPFESSNLLVTHTLPLPFRFVPNCIVMSHMHAQVITKWQQYDTTNQPQSSSSLVNLIEIIVVGVFRRREKVKTWTVWPSVCHSISRDCSISWETGKKSLQTEESDDLFVILLVIYFLFESKTNYYYCCIEFSCFSSSSFSCIRLIHLVTTHLFGSLFVRCLCKKVQMPGSVVLIMMRDCVFTIIFTIKYKIWTVSVTTTTTTMNLCNRPMDLLPLFLRLSIHSTSHWVGPSAKMNRLGIGRGLLVHLSC